MHTMNTTCPSCNAHLQLVSEVTNKDILPEDGDFTLCFTCGKWAVFDKDTDGGLRMPNPDESMEIAEDDLFADAWMAWAKVKGLQ